MESTKLRNRKRKEPISDVPKTRKNKKLVKRPVTLWAYTDFSWHIWIDKKNIPDWARPQWKVYKKYPTIRAAEDAARSRSSDLYYKKHYMFWIGDKPPE
jgi:hypothetical protein